MIRATVRKTVRREGVAGQFAYDAVVTYAHEDGTTERYEVAFVSSVYGAPVVLVTEHGQVPVLNWRQYGDTLTPEWIRRFYR